MDKLVFLLPILACPIMMGVMMLMMRGGHGHVQAQHQGDPNTLEEIALLRAEIAALRAGQAPHAEAGEPARPGGQR